MEIERFFDAVVRQDAETMADYFCRDAIVRWHCTNERFTAEEYIRAADERRGTIAEVKNAIGIRGRELTKTEQGYVSSWLDMGYGADVIAVAYDRTVTNTGALKWNYMNKILLSWHEKGVRTARDIDEKDGRQRSPGAKSAAAPRGSRPADFEGLDSLLDKI